MGQFVPFATSANQLKELANRLPDESNDRPAFFL
jgi:hypothetical protein